MANSIREIELSKGFIAIVDEEEYNRISQYKWFASHSGKSGIVYAKGLVDNKPVYLHRFIMNENNRYVFIDHIDGNPLNNLKTNLRRCSPAQNQMNKKLRKNVNKRYIGVQRFEYKGRESWSASVWIGGKPKHIGTFKTEVAAAIAYNEAAKREKGEFAKLNIIVSSQNQMSKN